MNAKPLLIGGLLAAAVLLGACEQQGAARTFDPEFIAREAAKGNLEPLKELNAACRREALEQGKRLSACAAQEKFGRIAKPPSVRF